MHENTRVSVALALLVLIALNGCGQKSETPVASATASVPQARPREEAAVSVSSPAVSQDEDLVLNDQFVSPDANAPAVSDEDAPGDFADDEEGEEEALTDTFDPLADGDSPSAIEVKFMPVQTTNVFVSGRQAMYAHEIEKRNERIRMNRQDAEAKGAGVASDAAAATIPPAPSTPAAAVVQATPSSVAVPPPQPAPPPIDEKRILEDEHGQWATSANASSMYGESAVPAGCPEKCPKSAYSPWQVTGAPNVVRYSDNPSAWTTKSGDSKDPEWLQVGFAKPVHATSIRIRQSAAPGAISRIELIDDARATHTIWEGTDETPYAKNTIGWFAKDFPRTTYRVTGARITMMTGRVWGWNQIDAVQVVGEE